MKPEDLLDFYRQGLFPMADSRDERGFYIVEPETRGLLPILDLHISKSLHKKLKKNPFTIKTDTAFADVIRLCADTHGKTWINTDIELMFNHLHTTGHAHSVECWNGDNLVGGLYGLALGGVFCGESMFSLETDASKIALVHLCAILWQGGFTLLDAQFTNPHLEQFGLYEIPQEDYLKQLETALNKPASFGAGDIDAYLAARSEK